MNLRYAAGVVALVALSMAACGSDETAGNPEVVSPPPRWQNSQV
jgi:hypothetical protein